MKLSVSLSEEDVEVLDRYVKTAALPSRSAAVQRAIRLLDEKRLASEYSEAFAEWESQSDGDLWLGTVRDGIADETW